MRLTWQLDLRGKQKGLYVFLILFLLNTLWINRDDLDIPGVHWSFLCLSSQLCTSLSSVDFSEHNILLA